MKKKKSFWIREFRVLRIVGWYYETCVNFMNIIWLWNYVGSRNEYKGAEQSKSLSGIKNFESWIFKTKLQIDLTLRYPSV